MKKKLEISRGRTIRGPGVHGTFNQSQYCEDHVNRGPYNRGPTVVLT